MIKLGILTKEDNKTVIDMPVITMSNRYDLYELSEKYHQLIAEKFHDEFAKLMRNPVKLPAHLKSVPEWQQYMNCCSTLAMRVIINAKRDRLFLQKSIDLPVSVMFLCTEK